jgi:SAM-dependent methyltransferase
VADSGFAYIGSAGVYGLNFDPDDSTTFILEDGVPLHGPANSVHDDIRKLGGGRYSFWKSQVYFSASDNSNPLENKRIYEIVVPIASAKVLGRMRRFPRWVFSKFFQRFESKPVNLQHRDASPQKIQGDVEYAGSIGRGYLSWLRENDFPIHDRTVLEIGPGINFGSTLVLACFGARVMVADRFLASWDREYHGRFYVGLRNWIEQYLEGANLLPLQRLIQKASYKRDVIRCYESPLEELRGIPDTSVDYIFSNATLEHLLQPERAFQQLARVSKAGGLGWHQIDFRDHHDFSRPLEFLLVEESKFGQERLQNHCERGNQMRASEYQDAFIKNRFEIVSFSPNIFAPDAYLDEFVPRLRESSTSQYRSLARQELAVVSGRFVVKRS